MYPSSSDDDKPLARNGNRTNGTAHKKNGMVLPETVSDSVDRQMDAEQMDVDVEDIPLASLVKDVSPAQSPGKRKARKSVIKGEESDEEVAPKGKRQKVTTNGKARKVVGDPDEDDIPLAKQRVTAPKRVTKTVVITGYSTDSDEPIAKKLTAEKHEIEKKAEETAKKLREDDAQKKKKKAPATAAKRKINKGESGSGSDVPIEAKRVAKKTNGVKKEESDDEPLAKKPAAKKAARKKATAPAKGEEKNPAAKAKEKTKKEESPQEEEEGEEEDEFKWWEMEKNDGSTKWKTLEHNGVVFPPPYEPLPSNVKLKYDGAPLSLPVEAEEVAGFFGAMLHNSPVNTENPRFVANFFKDFQDITKKHGGAKNAAGKKVIIKTFDKCDFEDIWNYYEQKRIEKKNMSQAEKKALKTEKDTLEEPYLYCYLDGRKEKVGNFRIEPPGLFRGRGEHPKTGMLKTRVQPEQVTINIGESAKVPEPPKGHKWAAVVHDPTVTWLATWKENINGNIKYVMLAATSSLKGMSDYAKFEKARELKKHIDKIRKDYERELRDKLMEVRQRATAMYLIDRFALRAGNEKGEEEADTVGCCSLRFEHVSLEPPNKVTFDFLGKDSIRYVNTVAVEAQVFKNLKIFKKEPKRDGDKLFDRLTTMDLNKHLQSYMPGLSAKVFRTYNASWTMQQELAKLDNTGTVAEKHLQYNAANRAVAILCNHQRTVTKGHETSMEKTENKLKGMKYQKMRLKKMMLALDPLLKKKDPEFFAADPDIDEEWIKEHQEWLVQQEREKIEKKFKKENQKLVAESEKELKASVLKERLEESDELAKKFKQENKTGKVEPGKGATVEKLENNVKKLEGRIQALEVQMRDKEDNKTVALGTSKLNYIDPRLTVMFCKKFDVPLERVFPKTLREKFKWAIESADENWEF
ncbi:hypothetical protein EV426DRAFT_573785 [Tirmania nivea]|nr:hypothetical protein EV426DRAFT_573785 [Tirmania nivea]